MNAQQQQTGTAQKPISQQLTAEGKQVVLELSQRYGISEPAVIEILGALVKGGGTMAQFNHPELGGSGQWSQGGMIMIGDMFNNALKATIDGLCNELAQLLTKSPFVGATPRAQQQQQQSGGGSQGQMQSGGFGQMQMQGGGSFGNSFNMPSPEVSLFVPSSNMGSWWPAELGSPSSTGAQNDIEYAYFPTARRLAINIAGSVTIYDTQDHQVSGVSQQQSGDASLTFTSQHGTVPVTRLKVVNMDAKAEDLVNENNSTEKTPVAATESHVAPEPQRSTAVEAPMDGDEIIANIEKLAQLHQKGILSAEEFSAKKAELLARL